MAKSTLCKGLYRAVKLLVSMMQLGSEEARWPG